MCQALCEALKSWFLLRVRALVPSGEGCPEAGSHGQELLLLPQRKEEGSGLGDGDAEDEDGDDIISNVWGLLHARHCSGCFAHINSILTTTL